ncbi:hypothetical protein BGW41_001592 [Actinomortierella wolfii]|nr:hypothetical protein BGW41_001592 [Actinomortierella wolfii]
MDDTGSSPESNSLASTFGSGSFDLGMASVNGSLGTFENRARQHLAAPLPIRQRSLPDIFRLGPCSGSYTSTSSGDLGGLAVGSAGAAQMPSSSPFYPTGSKALFLGVTFDYDGTQSSPVKLHSIPERSHQQPGAAQPGQNQLQQQQQQLHQQCTTERGINNYNSSLGNNTAFLSTNEVALGDFGSDEEGDLKTDLGYLPSSLSELLNSGNRQSQQEAEESTTGVHSTNVLPSPASTLREEKDEEIGSTNRDPLEAFRNRFQSSTDDFQRDTRHDQPAQNRATQNDRQFSVYTDIDDASFFSHTVYDISRDGSKSSSSTSFHPLSSQFNGLLYDDYGRIDQTPFHQHQSHFPEGSETYNLKDTFPLEATNSTSRSGTPDPFCPFRQEADEVQFAMDDDLPVATSGPTDSICSNPLGLGLYGEPPVSPSQLHLSSPTLASYASALQSPTSRHLGDLDKPTKHEELGEPLSDKQDLHDNLVALMNSLDIAKTGANSV